MCWNTHHGTIAITHQHIVTNPDFNLLTSQRMRNEQTGWQTFFFFGRHFCFCRTARFAFFDERSQLRIIFSGDGSDRMLRCHGTESHTHNRVWTRGEDEHFAVLYQCTRFVLDLMAKRKTNTLALTNPIALHGAHLIRPAVELIDARQQFFRILRDTKVVTWNLTLFNDGARTPTATVDNLLVRQYSLINRVPVHHLRFFVSDALFQHLQK